MPGSIAAISEAAAGPIGNHQQGATTKMKKAGLIAVLAVATMVMAAAFISCGGNAEKPAPVKTPTTMPPGHPQIGDAEPQGQGMPMMPPGQQQMGQAMPQGQGMPAMPPGNSPMGQAGPQQPGAPTMPPGAVPGMTMPSMQEAKEKAAQRKVVVPDSVAGKWKSVTLQVKDKKSGSTIKIEAPVGGSVAVPGSNLKVEILMFLPSFFMSGDSITSVSNDLNNPAAGVRITESGKIVHDGWLFENMPDVHPFVHERFQITITGQTPAK